MSQNNGSDPSVASDRRPTAKGSRVAPPPVRDAIDPSLPLPKGEGEPKREGRADEKGGYPFPRSARLLASSDYRRVTEQGKKTVSPHFLLFVRRPTGQVEPRLGMTVSKKVGNAVVRNRTKRTVREFFRHHRGKLKAPFECVVIARPRAGQDKPEALRRSLTALFTPYQRL